MLQISLLFLKEQVARLNYKRKRTQHLTGERKVLKHRTPSKVLKEGSWQSSESLTSSPKLYLPFSENSYNWLKLCLIPRRHPSALPGNKCSIALCAGVVRKTLQVSMFSRRCWGTGIGVLRHPWLHKTYQFNLYQIHQNDSCSVSDPEDWQHQHMERLCVLTAKRIPRYFWVTEHSSGRAELAGVQPLEAEASWRGSLSANDSA